MVVDHIRHLYRHFWILVKHVHVSGNAPSIDDIFPSHWITSRFTKKIRRNPETPGSLNIQARPPWKEIWQMVLSGSWRLSWRAYVHVTRVACVASCDPGLPIGNLRICHSSTFVKWMVRLDAILDPEILDDQREWKGDRVADLTVFRERFSSGEIMRRQPDYVLNEHRSRFNPKAISFWVASWAINGWMITLPPGNRFRIDVNFLFFFLIIWFLFLSICCEDSLRKEKWIFGLLFLTDYLVISKNFFWRLDLGHEYNLFFFPFIHI